MVTPDQPAFVDGDTALVLDLARLSADRIGAVGGKAANLGELIRAGFDVPPGFCVTTEAYRQAVRRNERRGGNAARMRRPRARPCSLHRSRSRWPTPCETPTRAWVSRVGGSGRGAIVGHRRGPARRELRRPAGHLPQRRRHRRCARRRASLLGVALDRPRGRLPRRPGHRRLRGRAGRRRAADGGRRVGGRAVHRRPGDGPAAAGRARCRARPRRRGGLRRGGPRPLRRRHRHAADPRPAARPLGRPAGGQPDRRAGARAGVARRPGGDRVRQPAGHRVGLGRRRTRVADAVPADHDAVSGPGARRAAAR